MTDFKNNKRSYELDLVRFLAAICVVIYHYKTLLVANMQDSPEFINGLYAVTKFGYLGVDLFFIISGYVIFSSALNNSCYKFSISRAVRIYPTFWVCVTLTSLVLYSTKGAESFEFFKYILNLTLFHSYLGVESIDGVYWTLVTEIKFYACIFVLLFFNWFDRYKIWIPIWLALTILFIVTDQPFFLGWFISPYYSPYFISGIVFYLAKKDGYKTFHVVILFISLVLACMYAYDIIDSFSKNISFLDRMIAVLIVFSFYLMFLLISVGKFSIRKYKSLAIMGGMTYPLYLLHNFIGKALFNYFKESAGPIVLIILVSLIILLMSFIIHVYFEKQYSNKFKTYLMKLVKSN